MRAIWWMTVLCFLVGVRPPWARAEDEGAATTAPDAPSVQAPVLERFVEAELPSGLSVTAGVSVDLVLAIDAEGRVVGVTVASQQHDEFAQAAVAAAEKMVFTPARRNGVPIAARIGYRYVFAPKEAAVVEAAEVQVGELAGMVLDSVTNAPLVGADVRVVAKDGSALSATTDANGKFSFEHLAAGKYAVRIAALEYTAADSEEEVRANEHAEVAYRLAHVRLAEEAQFGAVARVEGPAREVVRRSIAREDLVRIAGTRGDALRVVELLPGVARPPAGAGMIIVRGSSPADSEVFIGGAPVYSLYHFGGLTSVANGFLLNGIDLYPGNFSVRYGRKIGGIVETSFRDPRADGVHGVIDINLIDASVLVETPIAKNLSLALAARRSYLDAWFTRVMDSAEVAVIAAPVYYDYQAIAAYRPSSSDKVRFVGYGSYDELTFLLSEASEKDPAMRGRMGGKNSFHRAQLEWHHEYSDKVDSDFMMGAGPLLWRQAAGPDLAIEAKGYDLVSRGEWHMRLLPRLKLNAGVDVQTLFASVQYRGPRYEQSEGNPNASMIAGRELSDVDTQRTYARPSAYQEVIVQVAENVELTGGLRVDYFGELDAFSVDPRFVGKWKLGSTTLRGGVGLFSQPPQYVETIAGLGNPDLAPVRALHTGIGVEQQFEGQTRVSLDGFYKRLADLIVNDEQGELKNRGIGRIYGLELMVRVAPQGPFSGFLSYTLSRSERNDRDGTGYRLFDYDQTHVLNATGNLRIGDNGWLVGSTFRLASGNPTTPVTGALYDANLDLYRPLYGETNSERSATFHRLDVRIEKRWNLRRGSVTAYLDLQNAYNRLNAEGARYNFDYSQRKDIPGLPIIPSFGLRGEL